jgi:metallo-beta-lactamase family protein
VVQLLRPVRFRESVRLGDRVTVRYLEAGHILGAAILELTVGETGPERRVVFSGDLGQWDVPIVPDPATVDGADVLILESTYGDREHPRGAAIEDALAEVVHDTARRGGNLLIPTFAIERAQELLLHLSDLIRTKRIPRLRTYLDSPMAADATEIYLRYPEFMDDRARATLAGRSLDAARGLLEIVRTSEASKALNQIRGTCIILAGSGMCTGGRIKHHLAHNLDRPESTVLFVGFQAEGTLGREILDGAAEVRVLGETHPVRAAVRQIHGLSGHADRPQLLRWLEGLRAPPGQLYLTHGEESAALALAESIREKFGWDATAPRYRDTIEA